MLEPLNAGLGSFGPARWIIVGAMTGPGSKDHLPKREWVENIVEAAGITHAPVFMKGNLADVGQLPGVRQFSVSLGVLRQEQVRVPGGRAPSPMSGGLT